MTVLLALIAAACYGVGDFAGGLAARGRNTITILLTSYPVGALLVLAMLPLLPGHLGLGTLGWGIGGGLAGLAGVVMMYSALAIAPMSVVSPVTAVMAAMVPLIVGVGLGERPTLPAWTGIVIGLGAVVLISRTPEDHPHGRIAPRTIAMALLGGVGFGLYFVCLARADRGSGIWPVIIARFTSSLMLVPLAWRLRRFGRVHGRLLAVTVLAGVGDAGANLFFLLASRHGYLGLAGVLTSLYPAGTVLLAAIVLRERIGGVQRAGLGLAAAAIVLITR